ncbi:ArsR/SmtB family transcription factor [Kribbella swartbergensis]
MIRLHVTLADLGQMRFASSPLIEIAESLYMLASGRVHALHRDWFEKVRPSLTSVDMDLLFAVVPARPFIADFLFGAVVDGQTTISRQLACVAALPPEQLERDLREVWGSGPVPPRVTELVHEGRAGARRLADALGEYWQVAIEPHWKKMRALLDDDVAFRAGQLTNSGMSAMLANLHPDVTVHGSLITIDKKRVDVDDGLTAAGLRLVPSIFVWPNVIFAAGADSPALLIYPARGVGNLTARSDEAADDALVALLGRSRAAVLAALAVPYSTTELAVLLRQSPAAVSQHLSILRRSRLVISWRNGRRVLYQQTDLGASVVNTMMMTSGSSMGTS